MMFEKSCANWVTMPSKRAPFSAPELVSEGPYDASSLDCHM